nr:uncharacterized protein zf(c2h2)-137 [Ciona intestinalis]|eukprot:XP_009861876.2 uncharacterized protein zf(c2h2)-137 [Ciona intestinalis]
MAGPSSPAIKRSVKMFSTEEELVIGKFMVESWSKNYRIPQSLLFDCLKKHLEKYPRMTRAKDNRPSSFWQQRFFERNQSVVAAYKNFKTLPYKEFPVVSDVMLDELLQELSAVDKPPPPSVKSKSSEDFVYEGEVSPQKPRLVGPNAVVKKAKKAVESSSGSEDLAAKVRMKVLHKRSKTVEEGKKKSTKKVSINKSKDDSGVMDDVKIIAESSGVKKSTKEKKKDADPPKAIEPETPSEPPAPVKYEVGENVQAKDCGKWYKAKIIEVDKDKGEVLVHFNGWGKRFDTIFPVGSELLRGLVQVVKKVEVKKFNVGDDVLSQWTDGKFYPGTVIGVKGSGSYVVMFFDGLKKLLRPNLLKPMSEKEKEEAMKEAQRAYLASIETKHTEPTSPQHEVGEGRRYRTSANDRERRSAARKESVEISSDRRNRKRKIQETPSTPNPPLPTTPPKVFHAKRARIDKISGSLLDKAVTTMETTTTTSVTTSTSLSKPPEMKGDPEWTTTASDDSDSPLVIDEEEVKAGRKARDHKNSKKPKKKMKPSKEITVKPVPEEKSELVESLEKQPEEDVVMMEQTKLTMKETSLAGEAVEIEPKHKDGVEKVLNGGRTIMEVAEEMSIDPVELREALLHHNGVISGLSDPHLLTHSDEENVINWIHDMTDYGWPITDQHIAEQIKAILTQQRKLVLFTNMGTINFPSTTWLSEFLERHPEIFPGRKKPLARFRFDREGFDEWLMRWICTLRVTDVVPNAVYYCDQTVFDATPKFMHDVTFTRGGVKLNVSAAKNKISILTCIGADGSVFEPFHLMPGDSDKLTGTMGFRKQGVVDSDVIFHWMREIFIKKIPHHRPVALLMDLSVEQINHNLLKFARDNKIILYRFLPAGACFLQHPDQKLFGRLRLQWKKTVISKFLKERTNQMIPVEKFQEVFKSECLKIFTPSNIKMCFELTKIYTPTSDEEVTTFIKKQESKEKRNKRKLSKPLLYVPPVETDQPKQTTIPDRPAAPTQLTPAQPAPAQLTPNPSVPQHSPTVEGKPPTPQESEDKPQTDKPSKEKHCFMKGETVLAKWVDCRLYFAKILQCFAEDTYKIRYFDGHVKIVKEDFLRPYTGEVPQLPPTPSTHKKPRHQSEDNRPKSLPRKPSEKVRRASESSPGKLGREHEGPALVATDLGTRSKTNKISETVLYLAPVERVKYRAGEQVLCRWTDRKFYPATVIKQKDLDHYLIKYFDNRKKVVKHNWLSPWKPPVSTTNQAAPSTQTTNQATAAVSTTNQVKGKDKPTNQDAGEPVSTNEKSAVVEPTNQIDSQNTGTNQNKAVTPEKKKSEVNKDGASKQGDFPVLFTKGSSVLARWKDCRSYPGTILAVHDDGQYTVQYYDGMTNRVRKEMVKAWDSTAIPKEKRGRPKVKESVRPEVNISKGTIPTSVVTTTNDNEDESKTIKCKVPGCSKIFRNQGSLKQHQKHFHHKRYKLRDGSPPKRKASKDEKEVSVKRRVSADYHKSHEAMEVKSRGTTEPKNRGTTEPKSRGGKPVIEILRMQQDLLHDEETSVESWEKQKVDGRSGSDAKSSDDQKVAAVEVQDKAEKELVNEDVVRCGCGAEVEGGFMIQCEGCLTWQHALCEGISPNNEVPPVNYVCKVCKDPPGVRRSQKFLFNNEFLVKGIPPTITNNNEATTEQKKFQNFMEATHALVDEVMSVKEALRGIRQQIIIADPTSVHPMLKLWDLKDSKTIEEKKQKVVTEKKVEGVKESEVESGNLESESTDKSALWRPIEVTRGQMTSSSDVATENDVVAARCRGNILAHIDHMESVLSKRTSQLEDYVTEIEKGKIPSRLDGLASVKSDVDSIHKLLSEAITSQ